ncbi:MAG: hypothetical protein JXB26_18415 [Candidatus Aminicenantes bacterium]|nr:hypothetical protein [Candidatus Aminicenantes bacterium]
MTAEQRPDVGKVLSTLKDFQKKSVETVFRRLYRDSDYTNRFLIADEVGLGKTLVARGVIAKSVDFLWDKVGRIDVIYICSNQEIAQQNINRLNVLSEKTFSRPSRLTLLPVNISKLKKNKLNFISFTPGTSFDLHSQAGIMEERALIYHLLKQGWKFAGMGPINLFQHRAGRENWRALVESFPKYHHIDRGLAEQFLRAVGKRIEEKRREGELDLIRRFKDLCRRFRVYEKQSSISNKDWTDRSIFISEMRTILARACLDALEPDLVILDEFQRFKHLLDGKDEVALMAKYLFEYKNEEMPTKIILLSATPYKMYTMHHEEAGEHIENHYEDFIRTVNFLFHDEDKTKTFEGKLEAYRHELFCAGEDFERLLEGKKRIEQDLRKVMIRTERLARTLDRNGMVKEVEGGFCRVRLEDIHQFSALDKISRVLGGRDVMEFWKSAPYLLNFMDEYDIKRRLKRELRKEQPDRNLVAILRNNRRRMLRWKTIQEYKEIEPVNAKMRMLIENGLKKGSWRLLWVPPSLPYYKPRGVFDNKDLKDYTKSLVFSSWQVVPKAISVMLSYEAERRVMAEFGEERFDYRKIRKARSPLLLFQKKEDQLRGMGNLTLLYPCLTLAEKIDPLDAALECLPMGGGPPAYRNVRGIVRDKMQKLLDEACVGLNWKRRRGGQTDLRWYWAALALLDRHFYRDEVGSWFGMGDGDLSWGGLIKERGDSDEKTYFWDHAEQFKKFFKKPEELGRRPDDLIDVLTELALASPAVVALRSIRRQILGDKDEQEMWLYLLMGAARVGAGFRFLYNLHDSIILIRGLYKDEDEPYWRKVLHYGADGNLQAVMDEYVHVLKESLGHIDRSSTDMIDAIAREIYVAMSMRTVSLEFEEILFEPKEAKCRTDSNRVRCRYSVKFGEAKNYEDRDVTREAQVRIAFNSPFRPFVLATTSIGQEGLDFHQYCRSIYHWNLPSNPVDLEQREGRIHRYKGEVIRKNLAYFYGLKKLKEMEEFRGKDKKQGDEVKDPWEFMFRERVRERGADEDDIVPFWICEAENGVSIERNVPCMPLSRDVHRYKDLKRTLVLYRMVFGQSRQEDLIEFLSSHFGEGEIGKRLADLRIDLSPR